MMFSKLVVNLRITCNFRGRMCGGVRKLLNNKAPGKAGRVIITRSILSNLIRWRSIRVHDKLALEFRLKSF